MEIRNGNNHGRNALAGVGYLKIQVRCVMRVEYLGGSFRNVKIMPKQKSGAEESPKKHNAVSMEVISFMKEICYHISNERYSDNTLRFLEELRGIEKYVGICGGGNQNLMILSSLQKNNKRFSAELVDIIPAQIENFYLISEIFSLSSTTGEYQNRLETWQLHAYSKRISDGLGFHLQELPVMKDCLEISFSLSDINRYLNKVAEKAKYFVYLSNVFENGDERFRELLSVVSRDKKFDDGTTLMLVDTRSIIRRKEFVDVSFFEKAGHGFIEYGKEPLKQVLFESKR